MPAKSAEAKALYQRQYYLANKERLDKASNDWRANKRLELIKKFGGKCAECGESDPIVLDFDHVNNDGAAHRKETKKKNVAHILAAFDVDPSRFQLLCKNCNWKKEYWRRKDAKRIAEAA